MLIFIYKSFLNDPLQFTFDFCLYLIDHIFALFYALYLSLLLWLDMLFSYDLPSPVLEFLLACTLSILVLIVTLDVVDISKIVDEMHIQLP